MAGKKRRKPRRDITTSFNFSYERNITNNDDDYDDGDDVTLDGVGDVGDIPLPSTETIDSESWGTATPTQTVDADDMNFKTDTVKAPSPSFTIPVAAEVVPWPGSMYAIRERATGLAITIDGGGVRLKDWDCAGDRTSHWRCEKKEGWLGFCNPGTDRYLGQNKQGTLVCDAKRHNGWEYFCATRHPDGGYLLRLQHWSSLTEIGKASTGDSLTRTVGEGEGVVWEFVKLY